MEIGLKGYSEITVAKENTAAAVGSGLLEVFSTPSMIGLMESAAKSSIAPFLEPGQSSVGMRLEIDHLAPTPIGVKVRAEAELIEISGKILTFKVAAYTDVEKIGEGIHKRCIITTEKFLSRMNAKY